MSLLSLTRREEKHSAGADGGGAKGAVGFTDWVVFALDSAEAASIRIADLVGCDDDSDDDVGGVSDNGF